LPKTNATLIRTAELSLYNSRVSKNIKVFLVYTIYSAQLKSIDTFDKSLDTLRINSLWPLNLSSPYIWHNFGSIWQ
jgi:hypothetical protein